MVALSGGVDSAVAAYLLKEAGYEVVGVTMCLGVETPESGKVKCCGPREIEDARGVCRSLGISHFVLDFAPELARFVIGPFVQEYRTGRTPNPCVECNRRIKFGTLLEMALSMGFDLLATGHYAISISREVPAALRRQRIPERIRPISSPEYRKRHLRA